MINLTEIKYSIRFSEEEDRKYKKLASDLGRPLSIIIRDALDTISENPALLNPTNPKMELDVLINALERAAYDRQNSDMNFQESVYEQFSVINSKVNYLLKKAKVSKKIIKQLNGEDISGVEIFD